MNGSNLVSPPRKRTRLSDVSSLNMSVNSCLGCQVYVERFTSDNQYKEDIILGLAMFTEQNKWVLTLTKRYALPLRVVPATHLETILTFPVPKQLVFGRELVGTLGSDLYDWITSKVLPLLDRPDTERLIIGMLFD